MAGNVWSRSKRRNRYQRSWNASDTEKVYVRDRFVAPIIPWWRTTRFLSGVLVLLLTGWAALLLWHPYFFLRHITVEASETRTPEKYREAVLQQTRGTGALSLRGNYFLFSETKLEQDLQQQFAVQSLQVEKRFPNTLVVHLVEKSDSIIALYNTHLVRITTQGLVTPIATIAATTVVGEGSGITTTTSTTTTQAQAIPTIARTQLLSESTKQNAPPLLLRSWTGDTSSSPIPTALFSKFIDFTTLTKTAAFRERGVIAPNQQQFLVYDPANDPYTLGHVVLDTRRTNPEITYWYDMRNSFEPQIELLYEYIRLQKTTSYQQLDLRRPGEVILSK